MSWRSTPVLLCQKLVARKLWLCLRPRTRVHVEEKCVRLQCYYSSLTGFTLSSKSAGWLSIGVYGMCVWASVSAACTHAVRGRLTMPLLLGVHVFVRVFRCGLLDLLSTSSLVLPPSLPSAYFTLLPPAHTLMPICRHKTHTQQQRRRSASLCWSHHPLWAKDSQTDNRQRCCLTNHPQTEW